MKKHIFVGALCMSAFFALAAVEMAAAQEPAGAQEQAPAKDPAAASEAPREAFQVENITSVNLGDGRWLHSEWPGKTPLEGHHRIIDGYHSEYIEADFKNGLYDGECAFYRNNRLVEKGTYSEGRKNGLYTEYYSDGERVKKESEYVAGKIDGTVKTYFTDGSLESERGFKNGKEHGPDRLFRFGEEEPVHEFNFYEGEKDGRQVSRVTSNRGNYNEVVHYNRGVKAGEYLATWPDGAIKTKGIYEAGKEHGVWQYGRENGKPEAEVSFRNGKRHGESKEFASNGLPERITEYADGERNGVERIYRYNSEVLMSEYTYENGRREGPYTLYFDSGKVREEGQCKQGGSIYRKTYYPDGQLQEVAVNNDGRWETVEQYNPDGSAV
jgi:antitoxin component YwqK of YwqJK toxin-antitoxin module